uniref:Uncharacterized protein n=1 Tax=Clandestinovirus TaxID=2831644 RepID=A0A8F8PMF9_9VIRU|nr:hypothetical protein KOM_12_231 [Clandestinovirus]
MHKFSWVHPDLDRKSGEWFNKTKEVCRVDLKVLNANPSLVKLVNDWYTWLTTSNNWSFDRVHLRDRLTKYLGALSKKGDYIELTEPELEFILNLDKYASGSLTNSRVVEVGFNKFAEVCKMGIVIKMPDEVGGRFLFICIGAADGGVKTCYVTPTYKSKINYQSKDQIPYLTLDQYKEYANKVK